MKLIAETHLLKPFSNHDLKLIALLSLTCILQTVALGQKITFNQLEMSHGLSDNWAKSIMVDHHGYLWVGTINGLNRYDGKSVKIFKHDPTDDRSISDNFIQTLTVDQAGKLWAGTYNGGVNVFDYNTEEFKSYTRTDNNTSLQSNKVNKIYVSTSNDVWIGTEAGLSFFNRKNDAFETFSLSASVYAIQEDSEQNIWVGTNNGIYVFNSNQIKIAHHHLPVVETVTSIFMDDSNELWFGTWGSGIFRFEKKKSTFLPIKTTHKEILTISGNETGHLYVGTEGGGLIILDTKSLNETVYAPQANKPKTINSNSIHSIYHDEKTGITWIGTYNGGVNFFSKWTKSFKHYQINSGQLNNNKVLAIEGEDEKLFVGTDGGGLNIIEKNNSYSIQKSTSPQGILNNAVVSLLLDSKNNLWIGTYNGGLNTLKDGQITEFIFDQQDDKNDVSALCESSDGMIWMGTMEGGVTQFDPENGALNNFRKEDAESNGLTDNYISKIFETSQGQIMIQTGKSLDVFDKNAKTFHSFDDKYRSDLGMPISTLEDSKGNIWVGTREALFWYDTQSSDFLRVTDIRSFPSNSIAGILEDDDKNLWVSTKNGLLFLQHAVDQPKEFDWILFTKEDGIQSNVFKELACHKDSTGNLYFGGQNGLTVFDPTQIELNSVVPQVILVDFKVFNEAVEFGKEKLLKHPINFTEEIILPYDLNSFSIEFASSNFLHTNKNQYAYKLEGFDAEWRYNGNINSASYTNIDPGNYTFLVKASNNDQLWIDTPRRLTIYIESPWWGTTWFKLAIAIGLFLGVFVFIRLRLYQLRKNKKELEKEVELRLIEYNKVNELLNERNKEIEEKNKALLNTNELLIAKNKELETQADKIKELLEDIQRLNDSKIKFFTNISHELRTPLTLILGPLEQLKDSSKTSQREEFDLIQKNAERLLHLVNQLLEFRKIETGNIYLQASKNDLVFCASQILKSFEFLARENQIDLHFESDAQALELWFDLEKMEVILTNLLSNAFKYTKPGGTISLSVITSTNHDEITISIIDSGVGIPEAQLENIFELYYQSNNANNVHEVGTGIGLALIKQYIQLHRGKIDVSSQEGNGTRFTMSFPTGKNHLNENEIFDSTPSGYLIKNDFKYSMSELQKDLDNRIPTHGKSKNRRNLPIMLIADDNHDIRKFIEGVFKHQFKIEEAENGEEAWESALDVVPDIVISDVMMPKMNGFELCNLLKQDKRTSHIPVILLTAFSGEHEQYEGFEVGADDYLTKPFNPTILLKKITNILQTRSKLMERFNKSVVLDISQLDTNSMEKDFLQKALELVDLHLSDASFGVDEFSNEINMSRRNLLRKIKAISGLSVNEFIRNVRLKRSAELLLDPEKNVAEVAYLVGFSDPKYYSKCFKTLTGNSPTEYVRKNSGNLF